MKEQVRSHSFTSSPYPYVLEYAGAQDVLRGISHKSMASSAPVEAFDPWVLEEPPCSSPHSIASSMGHSECVDTPPHSDVAIYDVLEPHFQDIQDPPISHTAWKSEPEQLWQPAYGETPSWCSESYMLPYYVDPSHDQLPLQPMNSYIPSSPTSAYDSYTANAEGFVSQYEHILAERVDSMPFRFRGTAKTEDIDGNRESDSASDSESDDSDYDDSASQGSSNPTTKDQRAARNVMNLGRWSTNVIDPYTIASEQRQYECPMQDTSHAKPVPCQKRFLRPEHLRRHVKTVHSKVRLHMCKVADCERPFSRGDNLRDHYWTHLERGGRSGKNSKMSFLELKAILGPRERKLAKRLKQRLNRERERQMMEAMTLL